MEWTCSEVICNVLHVLVWGLRVKDLTDFGFAGR